MKETNQMADWKAALENPENFTGTIPDKDRAWQKLQSRLPVKKRGNWLPVYWIAASIILLLSLALFLQKINNRETTIPGVAIKNSPVTGPVENRRVVKDKITWDSSPVLVKSNAIKNKRQKVVPVIEKKAGLPAPLPYEPPVTDEQKQSLTEIVVKKPVIEKKKLIVIHINDITPVKDPNEYSGNENEKYRRFVKRVGLEITPQPPPMEVHTREHILFKKSNTQN